MVTARLVVTAKPRAAKQGVSVKAGVVVVAVRAVAEDGKANAAVVDVVAEFFGVARSRVAIVRGEKSRHKELVVDGLSDDDVRRALADLSAARGP